MKIKHLAIGLIAATTLYSCGGGEAPATETVAVEETTEAVEESPVMALTVDTEASSVSWSGGIVGGGYGHTGTLAITEASLEVANGAVSGGSFTVDMSSIQTTDDSYTEEEGHTSSDLIGHLSSDDFFAVEANPTASFVITGVEGATVTGDLTVRGTTKAQTIEVTSSEITEEGATITGTFTFNRQDFAVAYVSAMKDMVISDDIVMEVTITATK